MKKSRVPTIEEIENLQKSGNIDALYKLNETLAKRANSRLKYLEYRNLETAAYTRAKGYIQEFKERGGGEYFTRKKLSDIDDLVENIKEEAKFLRSQTSTVTGEMRRREKIFNTLTKKDENGKSIIPVPATEDRDSYKKKFLDFLDSDVWDEIKKSLYSDTNVTMDEAGEAIAAGATLDDLVSAYNDYLSKAPGETDIFEVWDNWRNPDKGGDDETD